MSIHATSSYRHRLVLAVLMGCVALRLGYDFLPGTTWPLSVSLGVVLGWCWPRPYWMVGGGLVYLAAPFPLPHLATFCLASIVLAWGWGYRHRLNKLGWRGDALLGLGALGLLVATLSPGMLPADAGEFQVVAGTWGVAHAPGYPLYTMLAASVAEIVPFGSVAWRVNLFSALTAAGTVALFGYAIRRETGEQLAGWVGGVTLLAALSFWMTATQASIRPLTVFFSVGMLEAALAYRSEIRQQKKTTWPGRVALVRFGIMAGLGVTHHGSLFFIGGWFALMMALAAPFNWRQWSWAIGAAVTGLVPLVYLPLRVDAYLAPDGLDTPQGFLDHVLARGFAGDMFALAAPIHWPERLHLMQQVYWLQWEDGLVLLGAVIGLAWLTCKDRWLAGVLLGGFVVHTFVVGTYRAPQIVEYALPVYTLISLAKTKAFMVGLEAPRYQLGLFFGYGFGTLMLGALGLSLGTGWVTMRALADQEEARLVAEETLRQAEYATDSGKLLTILANWHRVTPLWYLQEVEGRARDVEVAYVFPRGGLDPMANWVDRIETVIDSSSPVLVSPRQLEFLRYIPYAFEDERISVDLPNLSSDPINLEAAYYTAQIAQGESRLIDDWDLGLLEVDLGSGVARIGDTLPYIISADWILTNTSNYGDLTTFVHVGPVGVAPYAQRDFLLYAPNAIYADRLQQVYRLDIPYTAPPGDWNVFFGAYTPNGPLMLQANQERHRVGNIRLVPSPYPPVTQHPVYRQLGDARLVGWDWHHAIGDSDAVLYLHWHLLQRDMRYVVEVLDREMRIWSTVAASVYDTTGYWTSQHQMPVSIASGGVHVTQGNGQVKIPSLGSDQHYVTFGNALVVTGWEATLATDVFEVEVRFLPTRASFDDIQFQFEIIGDRGRQVQDFTPIAESIPSFKWAYNRPMVSQHEIRLDPALGNVIEVRLSMYDGFTGRVFPVGVGLASGHIIWR